MLRAFAARIANREARRLSGGRRLDLARAARGYGRVALVLCNTLLALTVLECAARGVSKLASARTLDQYVATRSALPYYRDQDWSADYWRESVDALVTHYEPFVVWREHAHAGKTIHIDAAGMRATPGDQCESGARRIFVFGGSTIWGVGAPDWLTIPAHVREILASRGGPPPCVRNLGGTGYTSSQGLAELQRELRAGRVPDLAIFYDGVNDVYAAYQTGRADAHQNLDAITARLEPSGQPLLALLVERSHAVALARSLLPPPPALDYRARGVAAAPLADRVARAYVRNVRMAAALGEAHGFEVAAFVQPFLTVGTKRLTPAEQSWRASMSPALVELFARCYERLRVETAGQPQIRWLADVFDGQTGFVWIDALGHVTPEGNRAVAEAIVAALPLAQ
jgi:lysophospholipase L1-like esterase